MFVVLQPAGVLSEVPSTVPKSVTGIAEFWPRLQEPAAVGVTDLPTSHILLYPAAARSMMKRPRGNRQCCIIWI